MDDVDLDLAAKALWDASTHTVSSPEDWATVLPRVRDEYRRYVLMSEFARLGREGGSE